MKTKSIGIAVLTLCLAFGLTARGGGAAVYVATNATPAAPHDTWATAFTNVQDALDWAAASGGLTNKIYLAGHTFRLTNQIAWTTADLTIRGGHAATNAADQPGPSDPRQWPTVLTRSGAFNHRIIHLDGANDSTLENVTITGGNVINGSGLRVNASQNVVLSGCIIADNHVSSNPSSSLIAPAIRADASSLTLTNCIVRDNSSRNTRTTTISARAHGGGIWSDGTLTIRDSQIINNRARVAHHSAMVRGGGLYFSGTQLMMDNVLLTGNTSEGGTPVGDGVHIAGGNADIKHSTVAFNAGEGIRNDGGGTVGIIDSIVWGNWTNLAGSMNVAHSNIGDEGYDGVNQNISADPLLEYGYYLQTNSPCVGIGSDTAENLGRTNYTTRTDGAAYGPGQAINLGYHHQTGFDFTYADLYVATDGNDMNSGTHVSQPLQTITKALALAREGTRIHLAAGVYSTAATGEAFPLTVFAMPGLRILGTNAATTVIDAAGDGARILALSHSHESIIARITLTGGSGIEGSAVQVHNSQNVVIEACTIEGNHFSSSAGGSSPIRASAVYAGGSAVTLTDCVVRNNSGLNSRDTTNSEHAYGGGIAGNGLLTLRDCRIIDNTVMITRPGATSRGGGVYFDGVRLEMRNVLLIGNRAAGGTNPDNMQGDGLYIAEGTVNLEHLTVAFHAGEGIRNDNATVSLSNSIVWGNWTNLAGSMNVSHSNIGDDGYDGGNQNISADPLFEYGYYLADGSPSIGAGSDTAANLGLQDYVRNISGDFYGGEDTVNMGYHYLTGFSLDYPDLYVSPDGDDGNAGTGFDPAEAFQSVTKALSVAHAGARIHVAAGVYSTATTGEQFPLTVIGKPGLRILGTNAATTVIDAGGAGPRVLLLDGTHQSTLEQVTITGGSHIDGSGVQIFNSQRVVVSGCIIEDNHFAQNVSAAIYTPAIRMIDSAVVMNNTVVRANTGRQNRNSTNSQHASGGGIASDGLLFLRNCRILDNEVSNARAGAHARGGGVYYESSRHATELVMKNVLLAGNRGTGGIPRGDGLHVGGGGARVRLVNATVVDNANEGIRRADGDVILLNCIVWNNGDNLVGDFADVAYSNIEGATVYPGEGNLNADPLFVAAAEGNYRLQPGSPSIDSGLNQIWMVGATDLDGSPRIMMGTVDMGCYETIPPTGTLIKLR